MSISNNRINNFQYVIRRKNEGLNYYLIPSIIFSNVLCYCKAFNNNGKLFFLILMSNEDLFVESSVDVMSILFVRCLLNGRFV